MDFDRAAERLARDQKKLRSTNRSGAAPTLSVKAKREADLRRKQQERMAVERQRKQQQEAAMEQYMRRCERNLGVKALSSSSSSSSSQPLMLRPTSIHGQGDKIALPVSVLEYLTNQGMDSTPDSPWIFRIAIPNPNYKFPASLQLQKLAQQEVDDDDDMMEDDDDDDDNLMLEAYLDELSHKYLGYTHGSVVEFTQEEGHVGLPATMAAALQQQGGDAVPMHRTVDPAGQLEESSAAEEEEDTEKTPGHLAWGAFEVPSVPVEVSLVKLPKGKACTLQPTEEAILNGFYNLKDIKLVLEQSLIRTRATLSVHDLVHTWHRGVKYDLRVTEVKPATYNAVVCINTDINVDFAAPPLSNMNEETAEQTRTTDTGRTLGSTAGRTLQSSTPSAAVPIPQPSATAAPMDLDLRPEPPVEQNENICIIQIRGDGTTGRRRFDIHRATLDDLFAFAGTLVASPNFQLVSRFPRRIFHRTNDSTTTLATAGLQAGQELLMVEQI